MYLAVYMEVVSFPKTIQKEVVPYVCLLARKDGCFVANHALGSILGTHYIRRIPSLQAWLGRVHFQRCTGCVCRVAGTDTGGTEGLEGQGCGRW
jgi:hypothetical protein